MYTFEVNGGKYETDRETWELLRQFLGASNYDMFGVVFEVGLHYGRIKPISK